jgi:hypothetical protein
MVPVKNAVMKRRRAVFNENRCALVFAYDDLKSNILRSIFVQARVLSIAQQHLAFLPPAPERILVTGRAKFSCACDICGSASPSSSRRPVILRGRRG